MIDLQAAIEQGEQDVADLVNSKHPMRDFSSNSPAGFRSVEDFDTTVMKGITCA